MVRTKLGTKKVMNRERDVSTSAFAHEDRHVPIYGEKNHNHCVGYDTVYILNRVNQHDVNSCQMMYLIDVGLDYSPYRLT